AGLRLVRSVLRLRGARRSLPLAGERPVARGAGLTMARKLAFDKPLFLAGIGVTLFGLVMIFSASAPLSMQNYHNSYHFLLRQLLAGAIGLVGMGIAMNVDYRKLLTRPVVGVALAAATV